MKINQDGWVVLALLFILVFLASSFMGSGYVSSQNAYRDKVLEASVTIEKARRHVDCQVCRERLDAILSRLERIEKVVKP